MPPEPISLTSGYPATVPPRYSDPPAGICTVTPSDTQDLPQPIRGFICGGAGNVQVTMMDGTEDFYPAAANQQYSGLIKRVWSSGTTATTIKGFY